MRTDNTKPKLFFFIAEDWYFWSHRLELAAAARENGWEVGIVTRVSNLGDNIHAKGLRLVPLKRFSRSTQSPFKELLSFIELARIYHREKPDLIHQVALKPVIYGTIAARVAGTGSIVNALAGLGFLFTSGRKRWLLVQNLVLFFIRLLFRSKRVCLILQNKDDLDMMLSRRIITSDQADLIRGSGVDIRLFRPSPEPVGLPVVILPSRMLWDKGVGEFVEAAGILNSQRKLARFVLVGDPDPENPASISTAQLSSWQDSGIVEWWGHRSDMPDIYSRAHIVCLPSYREGLPKVLLEAAASGRAIVTTDVPGCREVVKHGENGLLVAVRNSNALANALGRLIDHPDLRRKMAIRGREIVADRFCVGKVVEETMAVYRNLLTRHG